MTSRTARETLAELHDLDRDWTSDEEALARECAAVLIEGLKKP